MHVIVRIMYNCVMLVSVVMVNYESCSSSVTDAHAHRPSRALFDAAKRGNIAEVYYRESVSTDLLSYPAISMFSGGLREYAESVKHKL